VTSTADPGPLELFERERPRLTGLAYRITASIADAEDAVQEAWIRWAAADTNAIVNPAGWLTTVTSRTALDRLRAQQRRREVYVGPWLPDPVTTDRSPEEAAELAESLTVGFLVVLDRLGPAERVAFLLAEVFGEPYRVIADVLGKNEDACRQLASRARRKVREARIESRDELPAEAPLELLGQLMAAVLAGEEERAVSLLDPDVVLVSDAGAGRRAARRPVVGARRVQRLISGGWRLFGFTARPAADELPAMRVATVNSTPSIVFDAAAGPVVLSADASGGRITRIWVRLNPDKTAALSDPPALV
jgi:RNA polymerase sigma-70 factor (ECF subfamily)